MEVIGVATEERSDSDFGMIRSVSDLDILLPDADFVVLIVPLIDLTYGLLGTEQFRLMKPSTYLINVGRGELIDEDALIVALRSGEIAGAALDVFSTEPLPSGHPLWSMPGVVVSPHMSADFHGWLDALASQFLANLER